VKAEQLEKFLKKESDRVWRKRGGQSEDLPDPQLTLPKEKKLEELRRRYEMREDSRKRKRKSRMVKNGQYNLLRDNGDVTPKLG